MDVITYSCFNLKSMALVQTGSHSTTAAIQHVVIRKLWLVRDLSTLCSQAERCFLVSKVQVFAESNGETVFY